MTTLEQRRAVEELVYRSCLALEHVHPRLLRPERFDPNRPRRRCSRCWTSVHPVDRLRGDFPIPT